LSKVTCVDKIAFGRKSLGSDVEAHLKSPQWTGATVQLGHGTMPVSGTII
jgi:hypothetical protein